MQLSVPHTASARGEANDVPYRHSMYVCLHIIVHVHGQMRVRRVRMGGRGVLQPHKDE